MADPRRYRHRVSETAIQEDWVVEAYDPDGESNVKKQVPLTLLGGYPATGAYSPLIIPGTPQALSGAGAVTVTQYKTDWSTTGSDAGTLADGTYVGQLKMIQMVADTGDGTLTPANFADGTTITFADVGDCALLLWDGSDWNVVDLYNAADGVSAPAVA